ncbi:MAG: crotonase/enoyl-CoA hydratase family protein [Candidatus Binatia bacterium]|nr:crotonase/enoyl-CoA hydratase family protein [Candidatus Binatia bacterium]
MSDLVTVEIDGGVADVRLNRPEKYNALSTDMFKSITNTALSLAEDTSLRAVVLSGNGKGFCAGLDFQSFQAMAGGGNGAAESDVPTPKLGKPANMFQAVAYLWKAMPVPVIAALHGVAYGGGFQIALGADIRIARPDARLSVLEIKWGLIPDMGITQTARGVIRLDVLKELTFTGRVVSGNEAQALGIVTRVSENPLEDALALAREIATKSPHAIRSGKKLFSEGMETSAEESLGLEAAIQGKLLGTPNQVESVMSNMEKRPASYADPE